MNERAERMRRPTRRTTVVLAVAVAVAAVGAVGLVAAAPDAVLPFRTLTELQRQYGRPGDRTVAVDGVSLHVRDEGPRDAPAIVLLHGSFGNLQMWDDWARMLVATHRVIRFDLPPNGLSGVDPTGRYGYVRLVELLGGLLDTLAIDRASVGGTSSGGAVAWRFAVLHPERVEKLVLVNVPVGRVESAPPLGFRLSAWASEHLFGGYQSRFQMRAMLRYLVADDARVTPALVEQYRDMANRRGKRDQVPTFVAGMTRAKEGPEVSVSRVGAPTLVIWSDQDPVLPLDRLEMLRNQLGAAPVEVAIVRGAGHLPTIERGPETAALARDFLLSFPSR